MASKSAPVALMDPLDFFPYRGQYGGSTIGAALFVAVRAAVPVIFYTLLAPPTSSLSVFSTFPGAYPSSPPPSSPGSSSVPFIPSSVLFPLSSALGLPPYSTILFLGAVLPSISFSFYNTLWRREKFPLLGQGGSFQVTTQVNMMDVMHAFLFFYTASRNPTWSPTIFTYTPVLFILGLSLQVLADHSKYLFRKDPKNKGKVLHSGVWGIVRHPNFLGFTIWRVAFATAAGGWAFGLLILAGFVYLFKNTSIPILEGYMAKTYGKQWDVTVEKVKWKMIPGIL
jgi:protein-S-isoprenylcysteine O-methyltransferase Ste14